MYYICKPNSRHQVRSQLLKESMDIFILEAVPSTISHAAFSGAHAEMCLSCWLAQVRLSGGKKRADLLSNVYINDKFTLGQRVVAHSL